MLIYNESSEKSLEIYLKYPIQTVSRGILKKQRMFKISMVMN